MQHAIRPIPLVIAAIVLATSIMLVASDGVRWWFIALGLIGPDLSFFAAIGGPAPVNGTVPPRVVKPYNFVHHPTGPLLAVTASLAFRNPTALTASLAWQSHLLFDRGMGYGLRAPDGSIIRQTKL